MDALPLGTGRSRREQQQTARDGEGGFVLVNAVHLAMLLSGPLMDSSGSSICRLEVSTPRPLVEVDGQGRLGAALVQSKGSISPCAATPRRRAEREHAPVCHPELELAARLPTGARSSPVLALLSHEANLAVGLAERGDGVAFHSSHDLKIRI
jgi:hypothetical protein